MHPLLRTFRSLLAPDPCPQPHIIVLRRSELAQTQASFVARFGNLIITEKYPRHSQRPSNGKLVEKMLHLRQDTVDEGIEGAGGLYVITL